MRNYLIYFLAIFVTNETLSAQPAERRQLYDAATGYINAFYKSDPSLIEKYVFPGVARRGFYWKGLDSAYSDIREMNYAQLMQFAGDWNKTSWLSSDAVRLVEVLDGTDKTGMVKITVYWGIEYLQFAKIDDRWKIINILWQSIPKKADSR